MINRQTYKCLNHILLGMCVALLFACSTTKYVPESEYLLDKVSVKIDTKDIKNTDLESYLKQKSNLRVLGLRMHLSLYNLSGKESQSGFDRWLRKIGEAPVIFDHDKEDASVFNLKNYLHSKGYYEAEVKAVETQTKDKHIEVKYIITAHTPYRIKTYTEHIDNAQVLSLVKLDSVHRNIEVGDLLDVDKHEEERERILKLMKKKGYYDFAKKDIGFVIDTFRVNHTAHDSLVINENKVYGASDPDRNKYQKYTISRVKIYPNFDSKKALNDQVNYFTSLDSLLMGNYHFYYNNSMNIHANTWLNRIYIVPNSLYNAELVDKTRFMLSQLKIVRYINIVFKKVGTGALECSIYITQSKSQAYSVDLEGTNSSGNYGGAVGLTYQHKNIFKGGEYFTSKLKLSREDQTGTSVGMGKIYSNEVGINNQLIVPEFMLPIWGKKLRKKIKASTVFDLDYNYQARPDYARTILTTTYGYKWKRSEEWSHKFNIMDLNYVNMHYISPDFQALIDSSYLYYSYRDHFIAATNYTLIYNNQNLKAFKDSKYMRLSIETAGNLFYGINYLLHSTKVDGSYEIAQIPYAQYVKLDAEFAYNNYIDKNNNIVYRVVAGVGIPYGNASVMPFERRFFAGGANGLRGWQVRSLGPGTYNQPNVDYYNQTGDVRLEGNIEYRFKLIGSFEGAFFSDAGNIWTIRDYAEQPGGVFRLSQFYKQLALDFGTGLRMDLSFVVLRFDLGMKVFDPSLVGENRWRINHELNFKNDFTFHFAIGYPF